jgi:hypothetical protein
MGFPAFANIPEAVERKNREPRTFNIAFIMGLFALAFVVGAVVAEAANDKAGYSVLVALCYLTWVGVYIGMIRTTHDRNRQLFAYVIFIILGSLYVWAILSRTQNLTGNNTLEIRYIYYMLGLSTLVLIVIVTLERFLANSPECSLDVVERKKLVEGLGLLVGINVAAGRPAPAPAVAAAAAVEVEPDIEPADEE